jgi:hypothetical protein
MENVTSTKNMVPEDTLVRENWLELKDMLKKHWSKLNDSDIEQIKGDRNRLIDILQARYGCNKQDAENQVNEFLNSEAFLGRRHGATEKWSEAQRQGAPLGEGKEGHGRAPGTTAEAREPIARVGREGEKVEPIKDYQRSINSTNK